MTRVRLVVGIVLGLVAVSPPSGVPAGVHSAERSSSVTCWADPLYCEKLEWWTLDNINTERIIRGLPPLRMHPVLWALAEEHSRDMAERGVLAHFSARGESLEVRLVRAGFSRWRRAAENLALCYEGAVPSLVAVHGWMMSPGHRQNILDPRFRETGIGVAQSASGAYYFTQVFLDP